jgi:hypothetical protein
MSRMILISSLAYVLAACGAPSATDYQSGLKTLGRRRVWPALMWVSPREATSSAGVSPIYIINCGPSRIWSKTDAHCLLNSFVRRDCLNQAGLMIEHYTDNKSNCRDARLSSY